MKRTLGGALIGALVLLLGLALRGSGTYEVEVVGGVLTLAGGITLAICLAKVALSLMRSTD